jgi:CubicO group peptidase (beta-lactamase class C family)
MLAWGLAATATWAQDEPMQVDPQLEKRAMKLQESAPTWMEKSEVPGMVLAGLWKGEFVGVAPWGVRNDTTGMPVTEYTVFSAASLTKPVVAYLVLQLVEEGVLRLDQPLADILLLPELAEDPRARDITVRMILSHTSGLPNWRWNRPLTIQFDPGSKFQYSGEGFVWLARVVEKATGESLQTLVARRVFEPLGMESSSLVWEERFADNFAVGHGEDGMQRELDMPGEVNAAASLLTTGRDYALFLQAVLEARGVSRPLLAEACTPQVEVAPSVSWGLGWGLQDTQDGRALFQWGDNAGYKAFVTANLDSKTGVVVFTNSDNGTALLGAVVTTAMGSDQPGIDWLGYESFNSPGREVRRILERVLQNEGAQAAIDEYHLLKKRYPRDAFREEMLNDLGYGLLRRERFEDAIAIFLLNVEEYPEAFNPYDSLGEAYMRAGDTERAIANYERSVELNPDNQNGVEQLLELRKKQE